MAAECSMGLFRAVGQLIAGKLSLGYLARALISRDDMPFRTLACMGYTRWVFCHGRFLFPHERSGSPYENRCPTSKISQKLGGMLMEFLHVAKFSLDAGQVSHSVVTKSWDLGKSVWANKILSYIKNLLGGVVGTVNVPGGVTMARFEDVKASWPAKHTGRITC
ncbi:hypothetical protein Tco_0498875 [Tanacetum coccineum]